MSDRSPRLEDDDAGAAPSATAAAFLDELDVNPFSACEEGDGSRSRLRPLLLPPERSLFEDEDESLFCAEDGDFLSDTLSLRSFDRGPFPRSLASDLLESLALASSLDLLSEEEELLVGSFFDDDEFEDAAAAFFSASISSNSLAIAAASAAAAAAAAAFSAASLASFSRCAAVLGSSSIEVLRRSS